VEPGVNQCQTADNKPHALTDQNVLSTLENKYSGITEDNLWKIRIQIDLAV
jgi:hypothetical protein